MKYLKSHEWARIEGDLATIGITDYAQSQLGDVVFIETAAAGESLNQGDSLGTIESTKAASEIFSPVSGEIVEVNRDLETSPQLINESPLEKGWIVKIKLSDRENLASLMDEQSYKEFVEEEAH